jgi:hypothetical protein
VVVLRDGSGACAAPAFHPLPRSWLAFPRLAQAFEYQGVELYSADNVIKFAYDLAMVLDLKPPHTIDAEALVHTLSSQPV